VVRFGVIGYGKQGQLYAGILSGTEHWGGFTSAKPEGCVLTAVSSRNAAATDNIRGMNPAICCFGDWRELLASDACDAVVITVPHFQHHTIAIAALQAGKHVLCEKPAGVRASDAAQMADCAANHPSLTAAMMLNQRCNPAFHRVKDLLEQGELGQLRRFHWIINNWWRPDSYYRASPWRGTWKGEGGGLLVNQLPHQLDLWLELCGMPEQVYTLATEGAWRDIAVENDVTVTAKYPGGATGVLVSCTHDPMGTDRLELCFDKGKILVEDSKKATVYRFKNSEQEWNETVAAGALERMPADERYSVEEFEMDQHFADAYIAIFENFAAHIHSGAPLIADGMAGLREVQLANAIQLSGWKGVPVFVPCDTEEFNAGLQKKIDTEA